MVELTKFLKNVIENNGSINITFEKGKPKINVNLKKESTMNEKKWNETILDLSQKIDWTKVNEYLKKIQNQKIDWLKVNEHLKKMQNPDENLTEQLDEILKKAESKSEPKTDFPAINIYEYDDKYEFWVYATGFYKEEIKIALEKVDKQNALVIFGEIGVDHYEFYNEDLPDWLINSSTPRIIKKEWTPNSFKRVFKLNDDVDITNIKAHFSNGILRIGLWKIASTNKIKDIKID